MSDSSNPEPALCRYCQEPIVEAHDRAERLSECDRCRQLRSQLYYARLRLLKKGPATLRVEGIVKTIVADMADETVSTQIEALLAEFARLGIDADQLRNQEAPSRSIIPPTPVWKVWSDKRLALLERMLSQGKTTAEIAEALSLLEKQIGRGISILRRRGR